MIRHLVLEKGLTAQRVLDDLKEVGYTGGYSVLKEFVRTFRTTPIVQPHLRFETEPGEQGQVDLSPYTVMLGGVPTPVVCFSMVFGFSRWQFIRFVRHADAHSVCHCHVLAFEEAGGVPHEILYDRMKQVVLESYKDEVIFHPLFEAMALHYAFRVVPLAPGYKEGKGKVENPFRFVEGRFLAGREFHDLDDLNVRATRWRREIALVRIHRTTQERPQDRLDQERPRLLVLPRRFDAAERELHSVGDDFCVAWATNRYSVPPTLTGQKAWARVLEGVLEIEIDEKIVARHAVRDTRHKRYMLPEHEAEFRAHLTSRRVVEHKFLRLGRAAKLFAEGLVEAKRGAAGYHMSRILELAERTNVARVASAIAHAVRYGAFDYNAVARIVSGKPQRAPRKPRASSAEIPQALTEYLKGSGAHQRPLSTYARLHRPPDPAAPPLSEDDHGERGTRSAARESAPSGAAPRRPKPR